MSLRRSPDAQGEMRLGSTKRRETRFVVIDKFFENQIIPIEKYEDNNMEAPSYCENFQYSHQQENLVDFSEWLKGYLKTEKFTELCSKYIDIHKRLLNENDVETRGYLFNQADLLVKEL